MDLISREQSLGFLNDLFGEMQTVTFNDILQSFEKLPSAFEGMTNGEVLQALFPNVTVEYLEYSNYIRIVNGIGFKINRSWWNAPYKAEKGGE